MPHDAYKKEAAAKLNEFATASRGFRKIVQNGRNEGVQPISALFYMFSKYIAQKKYISADSCYCSNHQQIRIYFRIFILSLKIK